VLRSGRCVPSVGAGLHAHRSQNWRVRRERDEPPRVLPTLKTHGQAREMQSPKRCGSGSGWKRNGCCCFYIARPAAPQILLGGRRHRDEGGLDGPGTTHTRPSFRWRRGPRSRAPLRSQVSCMRRGRATSALSVPRRGSFFAKARLPLSRTGQQKRALAISRSGAA
jgi:hypothetical protein